MTHKFVCKYADYQAVISGCKTFQIVTDESDYSVGDYLVYAPVGMDGRPIRVPIRFYRITYIEAFYKEGSEHAILAIKAS